MCPDAAMPADLEVFLGRLSLEITAKHVDKLPLLQARLKRGTQIFIALIDPADAQAQIEAAGAVRRAGFEPVPHLPARFIKDKDDLFARVARLSGHGVTEILVLGGGAPEPLGVYDAAVQLIETGVFESHGIRRLGLAGHPEGNPDIVRKHGAGMLLEALKAEAGEREVARPRRSSSQRNFSSRPSPSRNGLRACVGKASFCRSASACRARPRSRRLPNMR